MNKPFHIQQLLEAAGYKTFSYNGMLTFKSDKSLQSLISSLLFALANNYNLFTPIIMKLISDQVKGFKDIENTIYFHPGISFQNMDNFVYNI